VAEPRAAEPRMHASSWRGFQLGLPTCGYLRPCRMRMFQQSQSVAVRRYYAYLPLGRMWPAHSDDERDFAQ